MADKHPSGNPELIEQHKKVQHKGDREISHGSPKPDRPAPGRGKPDKEEGVGTVQNQKR